MQELMKAQKNVAKFLENEVKSEEREDRPPYR